MRLAARHSGSTLGFNMTSMIDIVFLLIIFFMAVSQFNRNLDAQLQLTEVDDGGTKVESTFVINIDKQQRLLVGGEYLSLEQLTQKVLNDVRQSGRSPDQLVVRIRCDRQQDSTRLNELMERLSSLGIVEIQLAVNRR
ncbi:MAG: biopolymer transporter ExbD [Pirellulaceae bacterium]|nr:biopolymer transporter ExbD [Pirellulaceae bacterium]